MKKTTIQSILAGVLLVTLLTFAGWMLLRFLAGAPGLHTHFWQSVYIDGVGSFRVPARWYVEWDDDVLYITDMQRENTEYAVHLVGSMPTPNRLLDWGDRADDFQLRIFSNNARLNLVDDSFWIVFFNNFDTPNETRFRIFVFNPDLSENLLSNIARTFTGESTVQNL